MFSSGRANWKKTSKNEPHPNRQAGWKQAGFTFAEVLAAMVFIAIVIPTALHGIALASRAEVIADRKTNASMLAERMLKEIILLKQWKNGESNGDFGTEWPDYHWKLFKETWLDSMRLITIVVYFNVQDREYDVRLSTLADESEETTSDTTDTTNSTTTKTTGS